MKKLHPHDVSKLSLLKSFRRASAETASSALKKLQFVDKKNCLRLAKKIIRTGDW